MTMPGKQAPLADRFAAKVIAAGPDDCWLWQGARMTAGYGTINRGGRGGGMVGAHRVAYELTYGPIPEGLDIDHLCRNRLCCNPAHLEPVTRAENIRRGMGRSAVAVRTGRCARGHALEGGNIYVDKHGKRSCKACRRTWKYRQVQTEGSNGSDDGSQF
jgi:hypothetical protein